MISKWSYSNDEFFYRCVLCVNLNISEFHWQPPRGSLDGYKHVVDVEYCPPVSSEGPHFPPEAAKAKEAAQSKPNIQKTLEYHEIVEGTKTL